MASKYEGLVPRQVFIVQRYSTAKSAWQKRLRNWNAKGVWVIFCHIEAHTGREACSLARNEHPTLRRQNTKLRAVPTWEESEGR